MTFFQVVHLDLAPAAFTPANVTFRFVTFALDRGPLLVFFATIFTFFLSIDLSWTSFLDEWMVVRGCSAIPENPLCFYV